jgi:hypothetical protein
VQFGRTLIRVLQDIVYANPAQGPVFLFKLDIADGFYRVWLKPEDIPKSAVSFPTRESEKTVLAFPLALPMGWVESPPYFCAVTETITDLANQRLRAGDLSQEIWHRLDEAADTRPVDAPLQCWWDGAGDPATTPLAVFDVYVDDFIGAAQGPRQRLEQVRRTLFESVDQVLRPLEPSDEGTSREEPISVKKLRKSDGAWATWKIILGWQLDTESLTIELTPQKQARLAEVLNIPTSPNRMGMRKWQRLLGELRYMAFAIPGGRNMFSILQDALGNTDSRHSIKLDSHVHDALEDFRWMTTDLASQPTHMYEWFPDARFYMGACDASKSGMGGVWFPYERNTPPRVWRQAFSQEIQDRVVTHENPTGDLTNSDLELAATLAQLEVAVREFAQPLDTLSVLSTTPQQWPCSQREARPRPRQRPTSYAYKGCTSATIVITQCLIT